MRALSHWVVRGGCRTPDQAGAGGPGFATVQRARARRALQALAGDLERLEGPDGAELFDIPGAPRPPEDTPAPPRLMAMWDSVLLACSDRSRVIPPDYL